METHKKSRKCGTDDSIPALATQESMRTPAGLLLHVVLPTGPSLQ